jgi:hypothetical protein
MTIWCADPKAKPVAVPGLVARQVGRGRVVYIPADLGKAAFFLNTEYVDRILADSLRWAASEPPSVEVVAPRTVIIVPQQQGARTLVHLLNDYSSFGRSSVVKGQSIALRQEVIPVRGIQVTFHDPALRSFTLEPGGVHLAATKTPEGTRVTVPEVGWHAIVVGSR